MNNATLAEKQATVQVQGQQHQAAESPVEATEEPTAEPEEAAKDPEDLTEAQPTGPRGGTTTVTASGLVKKNFWLPDELAENLREMAFRERTSEAEIMRNALRQFLEEAE